MGEKRRNRIKAWILILTPIISILSTLGFAIVILGPAPVLMVGKAIVTVVVMLAMALVLGGMSVNGVKSLYHQKKENMTHIPHHITKVVIHVKSVEVKASDRVYANLEIFAYDENDILMTGLMKSGKVPVAKGETLIITAPETKTDLPNSRPEKLVASDPEHWMYVHELKTLLGCLPDDAWVTPNDVHNLAVHKMVNVDGQEQQEFLGFIDFLTNEFSPKGE